MDCCFYDINLSDEFIEKFQDKIDWTSSIGSRELSGEFIEKYGKFIEKYEDKIDWNYIIVTRNLPEEFIEKYHDKLKNYSI